MNESTFESHYFEYPTQLRDDANIRLTLRSVLARFLAYAIAFSAIMPLAYLLAFYAPNKLVGFWASVGLFLLACWFVFGESRENITELKKSIAMNRRTGRAHSDEFLWLPWFLLLTFLIILVSGYGVWGSEFMAVETAPTFFQWAGYLADECLAVISLGTLDLYGYRFSNFGHAYGVLPPTLILIFRAALASALISLGWRGIMLIWHEGADARRVDEGTIALSVPVIQVWDMVTETEKLCELEVPFINSPIDRDKASEGTEFTRRSLFNNGGPGSTQYITEWHPPNVFGYGPDIHTTSIRFLIKPNEDGCSLTYSRRSNRTFVDRLLNTESSQKHIAEYVQKTLNAVKRRCNEGKSANQD